MVLLTSTAGVSLGVAGAGPVGGPAQAAPPSAPATKPCGGVQPTKADGTPWVCTFGDEFSGRSLDSNKWMVQTTAISGFATSDTCYVNNSRNVAVRDGMLRLVARTESRPLTCAGAIPWSTQHTGGAVVSWNRFAQAYGRFEFRAKYPATREAGFWSNLWLYPQDMAYGKWPLSGEVDIAEHWSGHGDKVFPSLHHSGRTSADTAWNCTVADATQFHTYRLEWTPEVMRFYYDDVLCFERSWTPAAPQLAPQPFDKRFFLVMSNGHGDTYYPMSPTLPTQGEMAVDWVRVYR